MQVRENSVLEEIRCQIIWPRLLGSHCRTVKKALLAIRVYLKEGSVQACGGHRIGGLEHGIRMNGAVISNAVCRKSMEKLMLRHPLESSSLSEAVCAFLSSTY